MSNFAGCGIIGCQLTLNLANFPFSVMSVGESKVSVMSAIEVLMT